MWPQLRRPALAALALLAALACAALLGRSAPPAQAAHCAIVPVVRGTMLVDQGLASYANSPLIRGHDTLVKVTLSQPQTRPSCAAATASAYLTGGTLTVTTGGTNLTTTPIQPTGLPATTFPLIAPYATTPPINSTGDPIFRIPASALAAPALTGRYTATITASITYESKSSATAPAIAGHSPVTATRNVTVEAPTNGWKLLVIPMGVRGQPDQFSDGALGAVASGMQTLSRLSGVPKGTESGTAALGESSGGVRYTVNQGDLVDVSGLLVDAAGTATSDVVNGKFCGKATNFASIEAQLGQFLQVWNLANRSLAADKAVGVSDELRSRGGAGCAEGMARVGSNTAWVRAMHAPGSPVRTGALLGMEGMHMLGGVPLARDDNFSPNHSAKTPADGAVGDANTGFNVASGLFLSDDRSVMKLSSQTAWLDSNTLYEPADLQYSLCAFGGTATTECKASVPTPLGETPSAADLIASFVMSGTTADTEPTTHLIESYATSMLPGTLDPDGPYFLEYRNADDNPIGQRFGVPVFEVQSHHDEDTGDSGTPTDKVFSGAIPFPTAAQDAADTIVFYKQTGPTTRVTLFELDQDGEAPEIVEDPTTTGGGGVGVDVDTGTTLLASSADDDEADGSSSSPSISADGRFVAFESDAANLLDGHDGDVFVKDLETGELEGVDVPIDGPGEGSNPSISADGRYVAFQSSSSLLVEGDTNGVTDIFVRDLQENSTTLMSEDDGVQLDAGSFLPDISDDGSCVTFHSEYVQGTDTNENDDVFMNCTEGGLFRVSRLPGPGGPAGNDGSRNASLSGDGTSVAFQSDATDLMPGDTNDATDIYVRRVSDGTMFRASVLPTFDVAIEGDGSSRNPAISADGEFVAFETNATNFSDLDDNESTDVYVRQLTESGTLELVSRTPADTPGAPAGTSSSNPSRILGPSSISADGRYVAFGSGGSDFVGGDTNEVNDAFVRDRERRETIRVSVSHDEEEASDDSGPAVEAGPISIAGRRTAFESRASDLMSFETSGELQAYVRDEDPPAGACGIDQAASTESLTPSNIEFVNATSRVVDIYWLNFAGERERYATLQPDTGYDQPTWITHPWVAVDHITGRCYAYMLSETVDQTLLIQEGEGGGEGEQQVEATVTDGEDVKADILLACPVSGEQVERHVVAVGVEPDETGEGGEASFVVPTTATCPGGEFEIAFNDGVNRTEFVDAGEPVIDADPDPPVAAITSPAVGQEFLSSRAIGAWGSGRSEEFGELAGGALDWTVKSGGSTVAIATGANPTFVLGAGSYTLELQVTDPDGRTTTAERAFTVLQDADKDGIPLGQETGLACVAAGATGPPDQDPLNAYKDGDLDGKLNLDEVSTGSAPCVRAATYEGISLFVPTTIDLDSTDRSFSAQAMRVDYVDMRHVNRNTVRIVSLAGVDVSTINAFRNTGFVAFREYAAATFNRQAIIAFLKSNNIPRQGEFEQVEIVVSGQGSTPIAGQNHNWTFITPGTVRVQK